MRRTARYTSRPRSPELAELQTTYTDTLVAIDEYPRVGGRLSRSKQSSWLGKLEDFKSASDRVDRFTAARNTSEATIADKILSLRKELTEKMESLRMNVASRLKDDFDIRPTIVPESNENGYHSEPIEPAIVPYIPPEEPPIELTESDLDLLRGFDF